MTARRTYPVRPASANSSLLVRAATGCRVLLMALLLGGLAAAQELPDNAQEALERGEAAVAEALATYDAQYPDRPLWRQAFREGRTAIELAPGHPEPLRFLARAYSLANWYGPAVQQWQVYFDAGGTLIDDDGELFGEAGVEYAFSAYQAGNKELAAERYAEVVELQPENVEAHRWLGRIALELELPEQAVAAWRTVLELDPDAEGAEHFLELAQAQARWGVQAATAFYEGIAAYDARDMTQARNRFAAASARNPQYAAAWAWLGRVHFEQEQYADANAAYARALELEPDNSNYQWFTRESERLLAPGADADSSQADESAPTDAPDDEADDGDDAAAEDDADDEDEGEDDEAE